MNNIKLLQNVDLEIMKEIIKICEDYNIRYYMIGGTFLGAIRHEGFIPWDDDVDLGMPRRDYEKFLKIAESKLPKTYKIVNYRNTPEYQYYITRILDTETKVEEDRIGNDNRNTNVAVDIFPIDGIPNNSFVRKIYILKYLYHRALMSLCYKDSIDRKRKRGKIEKIFLFIMEHLPIEKITNPYKQKCKLDKLFRKYDYDKCKYIGNMMGVCRQKEIMPKEYLGQGKKYKFENNKFIGPDMYDEYLKHLYGNYMKIPPEEDRKTHYIIKEIHGKKVD